jgi:hypothetical protein
MPSRKAILVTGAPRSGTTTAARYFQAQGLDVAHERMGADGASSYYWFRDHPVPQAAHEGRRSDYAFGRVIHLVRDPLLTIASMADLMSPPGWFRQKLAPWAGLALPEDRVAAAARVWAFFTEETVADEVWRLEEWAPGIHANHHPNRADGSPRPALSWEALRRRDPAGAARAAAAAARVGYSVPAAAEASAL